MYFTLRANWRSNYDTLEETFSIQTIRSNACTAIFLFLIRGERKGYLRNKRYSLTTYIFNAAKLKQTRHTDIPISTMHGKRPKSGPPVQMTILWISSGISLTHIYIHQPIFINGSIHTTKSNRLNLLPELLITWHIT